MQSSMTVAPPNKSTFTLHFRHSPKLCANHPKCANMLPQSVEPRARAENAESGPVELPSDLLCIRGLSQLLQILPSFKTQLEPYNTSTSTMVLEAEDVPNYKDLPPVKGMPHGCVWGLFDKDGVKDQLGTLNYLTPKKVQRAKDEIQTGVSVSLK